VPATPYIISGTAYEEDGTSVISDLTVKFRNRTTNETTTTTTTSNGQYLYDLANLASGYTIGDIISINAVDGDKYCGYAHVTTTSYAYDLNIVLDKEFLSTTNYCSILNIRNQSRITESELSDTALGNMIEQVTETIDLLTGRTWKGVQTVTDEYLDGDDTDVLWMPHIDLQSLTSLAIDNDRDGTYTDVTTSYVNVYNEGKLVIWSSDAEVKRFTAGPKTVKVSYTYGHSSVPADVRQLCILMVLNQIHIEDKRTTMINRMVNHLKWKGPMGLA